MAFAEAQSTIASLQASASTDSGKPSPDAWTDEMEARFQARLQSAVDEETAELCGQLAAAAAELEAAEQEVMHSSATPQSAITWPLYPCTPNDRACRLVRWASPTSKQARDSSVIGASITVHVRPMCDDDYATQAAELDGERDAAVMEGCLLEEDLVVARSEAARLARQLAELGDGDDAVRGLPHACLPASGCRVALRAQAVALPTAALLSSTIIALQAGSRCASSLT